LESILLGAYCYAAASRAASGALPPGDAAGLNAAFVLGWLGALAEGIASLRQYARGTVHA